MLKKILEKIKSISKFWWLFLAILVVGMFLRVWNHHDWLRFNADQGRDAQIVSDVVDGSSSWPLLGPKAGGTEFRLGPAFYYFEIVSAKIFGDAPDKMAYPDWLTSVLSIPLLYLFLKKYFEKNIAIALLAVFSVSAYAVFYSRFAWNPNSLPFWTMLSLYALHEVISGKRNRKYFWAALAGIAIGIDVQLHTTMLVILPITVALIFAYFIVKNKKNTKYLLVTLAIGLLANLPLLISEFQTEGDNTKAFFRGLNTKNEAESTLLDNSARAASCWVQGNAYIISGYEISDTCSFTFGKDKADTSVFIAGIIFVVGGIILAIRNFLKEEDADRKTFLAILFVFSAVTFLIFWKMAFELSVRFYLPLVFLPFFLLGFWIRFIGKKFGIRRAYVLFSAVAVFSVSNLFFVHKYYSALADYSRPGGGSVDVVILKEAEVFSQFIADNSSGSRKAYLDGNGQLLFKGFKSIRYLVRKKGIDLLQVSKSTHLPNRYFYIASLKKKDKLLKDKNIRIIRSEDFGGFSILLLEPSGASQ